MAEFAILICLVHQVHRRKNYGRLILAYHDILHRRAAGPRNALLSTKYGISLLSKLLNTLSFIPWTTARVPSLLFCAIFLRIWKQNLPLKWAISDVFLTQCLPIAFTPTSAVCSRYWMWKFFSLNCSKFAVESDWNSMISQNVPNLGFFEKKILNFFKIDKGGKFAVECVSNGIVS